MLQLAANAHEPAVVEAWTRWIDDRFPVADTLDVMAVARYRGPSTPDVDALIGMGWLYAVHARSAIARERLWQAVMMLDDLRNQIIALACIRHGLSPWHGRDVDHLPAAEKEAPQQSRSPGMSEPALQSSKRMLIEQFLAEVAQHDSARAHALAQPLHRSPRRKPTSVVATAVTRCPLRDPRAVRLVSRVVEDGTHVGVGVIDGVDYEVRYLERLKLVLDELDVVAGQ